MVVCLSFKKWTDRHGTTDARSRGNPRLQATMRNKKRVTQKVIL
jgi:hypothetical protein